MDGGASETAADAKSAPDTEKRRAWDDEARDSLHILPLSAIPLETPGLQHARLIKNVRLQTVVEMFRDAQTGSGQVSPRHIPAYFESYKDEIERDLVKLEKIGAASSFDVYSSRIELRRLNIDVNNVESLTLSDRKKAELTNYMRVFTRPLMEYVYGTEELQVSDVTDIIQLFAKDRKSVV